MKSYFAAALAMLVFSLLMANVVSAYGYGTSSISLNSNGSSLAAGGSTSVGYTVSLASGSTWGTTLSVVNAQQLSSSGISVSLSNTYGDPTYSGTMTVNVGASAQPGNYTITLSATGDDPSTSNANFALTVLAPAPATTAQTTTAAGQTTSQQTTSVQPTTTAPQSTTTANYTPTGVGAYYSPGNGTAQIASSVLIVIIVLAALYGLFAWKSRLARLAVIGAALILIGIVAWLYGDYAGGIQSYIWGGVAAIVIGTVAWTYGDAQGGTFRQKGAGRASYLGIALIVIGLLGWIYGELGAPGVPSYWWGGTALLAIGTLVWLYGDVKAGAFLRKSR